MFFVKSDKRLLQCREMMWNDLYSTVEISSVISSHILGKQMSLLIHFLPFSFQIRTAFFRTIAGIVSCFPGGILQKFWPKLCSAVFNRLDDAEILPMAAAWDAALTVTLKCEVLIY